MSERDDMLGELDAQVYMLGRLFSARHGSGAGSGPAHTAEFVEGECTAPVVPGLPSAPQALLIKLLSGHGPLKMSDIATMLGIKPPAASALVDGVEKLGLIERAHDDADRRVCHVLLTDSGKAALVTGERRRRELMERYTSVLTEEDIANLLRIQRKLIEGMTSSRI